MSSLPTHPRAPFKSKPGTPIIVTTPAPQFILTVDPPSTPSLLPPDDSKGYLKPPLPSYPSPSASVRRTRSAATFRSSPLAGPVLSSDSLDDDMKDEKISRRFLSVRERTESGMEKERHGLRRPLPMRAASTDDKITNARPPHRPLSSHRSLSDLSILRRSSHSSLRRDISQRKEPPILRTAVTAPMSAEGLWRSSAEVPVFSRKLLKAQNVVMPVKASSHGASRLRKHSGAHQNSHLQATPSIPGMARSKSESNLASRHAEALTSDSSPAKLHRVRRKPPPGIFQSAEKPTETHLSTDAVPNPTARKLRKVRTSVHIPQNIREEESSEERQPQAELSAGQLSKSNVRPPPLLRAKSTSSVHIGIGGDANYFSLGVTRPAPCLSRSTLHKFIPLPEIDVHSQVFSWFGPRSPGSPNTPSSPTLSSLLNNLIPAVHIVDGDSAPTSPRGSTTESVSEFDYTSSSGRSTPSTAPGTPCLSVDGSWSSLKDLVAVLDSTKVGKAIPLYTSEDSDTGTTKVSSLLRTMSDERTIKDQLFIDVSSSPNNSRDKSEKREIVSKDRSLNLFRNTRSTSHPVPRSRSVMPFPYESLNNNSTEKDRMLKRRPSFFKRVISCVYVSGSNASTSQSAEKRDA